MTDYHKLYQQYYNDIFRFTMYLSGNATDAEDLTAETFVRAISGKSPLILNTVKGYLLTIARNLYLEQCRKQSRDTELSDNLLDRSPGLEHRFEQEHELENLLTYLQTLPEVDRSALLTIDRRGQPTLLI